MNTVARLLLIPVTAAALALPAAAQDEPAAPPRLVVFDPTNMDTTADPCQDFYQYACGGWNRRNPLPADRSTFSTFSQLGERNELILRDLLEKAAAPAPGRGAVEKKIGDYYASCMDEKAIEAKGIAPIQADLDRIARMKDKAALAKTLAHFHLQGTDAAFRLTASQDAKDSTRFIASAGQGGLGLPSSEDYSAKDPKSVEIREKYVAYLQKALELLGEPADRAAAQAKAVMALETALASGALSPVERRKPENRYNLVKTGELAKLAPAFDWQAYFAAVGLSNLAEINAAPPAYFQRLGEQVANAPLDDWKAYLRTRLVSESAPALPKAFVDLRFDFFERTLRGVQQQEPRWRRCVDAVDRDLGEALGQRFVETAYGEKSRERMAELITALRKAMSREIQSLEWMGDATKKEAQAKLAKMGPQIGYPKTWRDYSALEVVRGDALGNRRRARGFDLRRRLDKIGKPVDPNEWSMSPPTVNAYYRPSMNDINFPAGILQPPFFDPNADDAVNFGAIGSVIGHEMTHGFDDAGRKFDAQGNLRDWWTPEDAKEFEARAACVDRQYSGYSAVDDLKVNGKLTMGENIADLGGMRVAYMALQDTLNGKEPPKKDGFTADQRFFLAYAQVWCFDATPEARRQRALTDPHSPGRYRANGAVSNMPEFHKAFGCKAGQPMVREEVCRVW
ncbi:MAG TPA: M13 family metallopeptidase [Thermoanaerobaculia bacterium]|nr:M13 family metallopeptidase [Thermoanaerobaculia bacterium]